MAVSPRTLLEWLEWLMSMPEHELKGAQRKLRYLLDLIRHCARELAADRAEEMAAALTYRTLFSLVPLVVLSLVLLRIFGGLEEVQATIRYQLYEFFGVPEVHFGGAIDPEVAIEAARRQDEAEWAQTSVQYILDQLMEGIAHISFASLGVAGVLLFVYAAMALAFSVEYDFNIIFDSPTGRPWSIRICIYWSLITLGIVLLALSLYATGQFVGWLQSFFYGPILSVIIHGIALLFSWVILFLLYLLMPNTKVNLRPALMGSFVAAAMWEVGKIGFQAYVNWALPYSAVYGTLGLVSIFLFWVYLSWLIVLFGLELAYTLQVMHGKVPRKEDEKTMLRLPGDPDWLIPILAHVGRSFAEGQAVGRQHLAEQLHLPARVISQYGEELDRAGLIHTLDRGQTGDVSYALARPPERIRIAEVLDLGRKLSRVEDHQTDPEDWAYLDRLYRAKYDLADGMTLAELISSRPEERPPSGA